MPAFSILSINFLFYYSFESVRYYAGYGYLAAMDSRLSNQGCA